MPRCKAGYGAAVKGYYHRGWTCRSGFYFTFVEEDVIGPGVIELAGVCVKLIGAGPAIVVPAKAYGCVDAAKDFSLPVFEPGNNKLVFGHLAKQVAQVAAVFGYGKGEGISFAAALAAAEFFGAYTWGFEFALPGYKA